MTDDLGDDEIIMGSGLPFKVVDYTRETRKGLVAASLNDFISRARDKLNLPDGPIKVVLEQDGTEVDDDEYFGTMERNTTLMVLIDNQRWLPPGKTPPKCQIMVDETDCSGGMKRNLGCLVDRLQGDLTQISMLGGKELELLSDMDPDSLTDIIPDRIFLEQLKEASTRFLIEKREAKEAMELLKLYHQSRSHDRPSPKNQKVLNLS